MPRPRKKRKYTRRKKKKNLLDYIKLPSLPSFHLEKETKKGIFIVFLFLLGLFAFLGFFDNAGVVGVWLDYFLGLAFGWGKWIMPVVLLMLGYFLYNEERFYVRFSNYFGLLLFILSFHTFLFLIIAQDKWQMVLEQNAGGGYLGYFLATYSVYFMGIIASFILAIALIIISFLLMFDTSLVALFRNFSFISGLFYPFKALFMKIFNRNKEIEEDYEEDYEEEEVYEGEEPEEEEGKELEEPEKDPIFEQKEIEEDKEITPIQTTVSKEVKPSKKVKESNWWEPTNIKIDLPLSLLNARSGKANSGDINDNIKKIKNTLRNFGIEIEMGEVSVGPSVTQYTFKPAQGVKLSKITTLGNDLSLALAAHPIRIEAPIPGKSLVGIEVPNKAKAMVGLREILKSNDFKNRKSNLMVALGNDVAGKPWVYDITKMPHLLVAGATNSGKSVCLNTMILSLLFQNNPDDLRFIMVDPKRVELPIYNDIPYLLTPVITSVPQTVNALKWCLNEMDRRLNFLEKYKKKNIQSYNAMAEKMGDRGPGKLPYIIFIIDELADLMVVSAKEIEASIIRLTQMARAVGIHLILATQRPSVDVITGLIKANTPTRIAFSVTSGTDSRTIIDSLGAEQLLGQGDMLFSSPTISKPIRIQGAFTDEVEIKRIVKYIKQKGGEPVYTDGITDRQKVQGNAGIGLDGTTGDEDELLEEAKEIVINQGKASTTFLQRRLRIGYARAASIMDNLEELGIIGPANGSKPREILISKEEYARGIEQGVSGVPVHDKESAEAPENYLGEEPEQSPPVFSEEKVEKEEQDKATNGGEPEKKQEEPSVDEDDEEDEDDIGFYAR